MLAFLAKGHGKIKTGALGIRIVLKLGLEQLPCLFGYNALRFRHHAFGKGGPDLRRLGRYAV